MRLRRGDFDVIASGASAGTTSATAAPPIVPGAASRNAPPFRLPGEHFALAVLFLLAGAVGLVVVAPDLAGGYYPAQRVIAVTHLFTLGWITTSIMGALYQFLPVALGEPIASVRWAHVTFWLYAPGLAVFAGGLVTGRALLTVAGAVVFGLGIVVFCANLAVTLARSGRRDLTWWALASADVFLFITLVLGLALATNLRTGYLGGARFVALGTHLHVALAGWVLLVMVGVAHRLLPMFLLSHGADDRYAKAAVALVASGALVLALLHHAPPVISQWIPAALIGAGTVAFLAQARRFYRKRHRPKLDPGMGLAAAALVLLGGGLVLAGPVMVGAPPRLATAYVLLVVLAISLFVAAHYYKIVPFLVWYHRYGPLAGKRPLPRVSELYSGRAAGAAAVLLVVGTVGLVAAVAAGAAEPARVAAAVLAAGAGVEGIQMLQLGRKRP